MYVDWNGREQEDSEMDAMREDAAALPSPVLLIFPCSEQAQHGGDCWNVEKPGGEITSPHVTYTEAYMQIYGTEPPPFDPLLGWD